MDARYFLQERLAFIRSFFDGGRLGYEETKRCIEEALPPYDDPPYSEDGEPAYLSEWMDAETAIKILGLTCVSLLSDSLKLYFNTLQHRVIGFSVPDGAFKKMGFIAVYQEALGQILETDWSDCEADWAVIEQIVLARNRSQHGSELTSFIATHDPKTLEKHPLPFFMSDEEREMWNPEEGSLSSFVMPTVSVDREKLFTAVDHVEQLADYIDTRLGKAYEWRTRAGAG